MREDPLRILLVEDNPGDARLIREMMTQTWSAQYELQQVDRLSTALDLLSRAHVSVVLLDLGLPDSQGLDTLTRILGQTPMVPIVVLTGLDDEETGVKAVQMGAQDFLVKGQVGGDLLLRLLRHAIERKRAEYRQTLLARILEELNRPSGEQEPVKNILATIMEFTGLEAIGLRLRDGHDFPYFATLGLPESFVSHERSLFARGEDGRVVRDERGEPVLECMCGTVVCGRTDPSLSFFTSRGSFWTNSTTRLLATTTDQDRLGRTRNQCNIAGFESVALLPLRSGSEIAGLMQLNDSRPDRFAPGMIESIEGLGDTLGIAIGRIRMEEALKESEDRLRAFMESATDGFALFDSDLNLAEINNASMKMWPPGTRKEDWLGKHITEIAPNVKETGKYDRYIEVLETGKPVSFEDVVPHPRSGNRHLSVRAFRVRDGLGLITTDTTERRKAQEELLKSEKRLREAQQIGKLGFLDWNLVTNEIEWSEETYRMYGFDPDKFKPTIEATIKLVHPDDKELVERRLKAAIEGREPYDIEHRMVRPDSSVVQVHATAQLTRDEDGEPIRLLGTVVDITERKRAEEEIRTRNWAIESSIDGIALADLEGNLTYVNPAFIEIWGHDDAACVLGKPAAEFWQADERASEVLDALRETGSWIGELEARRKDGSSIRILLSATMVADEAGNPVCMMGSFSDVTALRTAEKALQEKEDQLRQSQKMEAVGSLAGGLAHDFNNLLTVITGYCGLMQRDLGQGDPLREHVDEVRSAAERAAGLTGKLLAFSRKQVLVPKVLDLNDLISGMENMLHRLLGEDLGLATMHDPELGRIMADPGQMEQVIMNLAVNAREAMPSGGKLTIETSNVVLDEEYARKYLDVKPGPYVMLAASDTGHGMDEETRKRIFEPFFTTKDKQKGTGLGLSTVFGIVKQSGGEIRVYSEPGKGTAFKIYLPLAEGEVQAVMEARPTSPTLSGNETVLVVEDDEVLLKLIAKILERFGYTVIEALNGGEALLACERHEGNIDLLVTDVIMPQMSGKELVDRLAPSHSGMKVIFMSGYTDNAIVHHGLLEEGLEFIQKPFTAEAIASKVREVLDMDE